MRKEYKKPYMKARKIPYDESLLKSVSNNKGNNGNHYGWDNPNNPHNKENDFFDDEINN